jgi:dTDP-4-amino-4,6-dideoxygalactose transaminase
MEALQGAILRTKLRHLDRWNELRRQHAKRYDSLLKRFDLGLPEEASYAKSVFHLYVIRVRERDGLNAFLNERGIGSIIHYPKPNHLLDCFQSLGCREGSLPMTEKISKEVLSLPLYPEMTEDKIRTVASAIEVFLYSKQTAKA